MVDIGSALFHHLFELLDVWLSGEDPASLLRPTREDSLQEWIVSPQSIGRVSARMIRR